MKSRGVKWTTKLVDRTMAETHLFYALHSIVFAPIATLVLIIPAVALDHLDAYMAVQKFTSLLSVSCCATAGALAVNRYARRGFAMKVAHVFCINATLCWAFDRADGTSNWPNLIALSCGMSIGQMTDPGKASKPIGKGSIALRRRLTVCANNIVQAVMIQRTMREVATEWLQPRSAASRKLSGIRETERARAFRPSTG